MSKFTGRRYIRFNFWKDTPQFPPDRCVVGIYENYVVSLIAVTTVSIFDVGFPLRDQDTGSPSLAEQWLSGPYGWVPVFSCGRSGGVFAPCQFILIMSGSYHWVVPVEMHTRVCAWRPSPRVSAILRTLSFVICFCFYSRMVLSASSVGTIIFINVNFIN